MRSVRRMSQPAQASVPSGLQSAHAPRQVGLHEGGQRRDRREQKLQQLGSAPRRSRWSIPTSRCPGCC